VSAQDRPFDTLFDTSLRDYSELLRTGEISQGTDWICPIQLEGGARNSPISSLEGETRRECVTQ